MLDYLLGRNPTGYSYVTGYGAMTPQHPHHRISNGDGVKAPVPGMLVGGPNPGQEDQCSGYPSALAAKSYVDAACSYASNEPAINQNAALILLAGALSTDLVGNGSTAIHQRESSSPFEISLRNGRLRVRIPDAQALELSVFGVDGRRIVSISGIEGIAELPLSRHGLWLVRIRANGRTWQTSITVP